MVLEVYKADPEDPLEPLGLGAADLDTNDYSPDPRLVGRRVEIRADQREIRAVVLDTAEVACAHQRSFAKHRTITALEHARALRSGRQAPAEIAVEVRPLDRYDALIA